MINVEKVDVFSLPYVAPNSVCSLPYCAGIYFITSGDKILYIGKAVSLRHRWVNHHQMESCLALKDARIYFLCVDNPQSIEELESCFYYRFRPTWNERQRFVGKKITIETKVRLDTYEIAEFLAHQKGVSVSELFHSLIESNIASIRKNCGDILGIEAMQDSLPKGGNREARQLLRERTKALIDAEDSAKKNNQEPPLGEWWKIVS